MTEREMTDALIRLLADVAYLPDGDIEDIYPPDELVDEEAGIDRLDTFETAGVLTANQGLVVHMRDGREFQVTVVQSR